MQNVYMRYPNAVNWILDGVDFKIAPGERLALVGPSGCGKSTIARVAMQLLPPASFCEGRLLLAGQDPRKLNSVDLQKLRGEAVGLVFQDPMTRLNPLMTIGTHLVDTLHAHRPQKNSAWACHNMVPNSG